MLPISDRDIEVTDTVAKPWYAPSQFRWGRTSVRANEVKTVMRKFLLTTVSLLALGGTAFAADLPSRKVAPVAPVIVPAFTWTGFYVGANAGYAWNANNWGCDYCSWYYPAAAWYAGQNKDGGFTGGGQVGYNYQIGNFVIGAEADIQYVDNKFDTGYWSYLGNVYGRNTLGNDWYGTVRARAGFAFDRVLVYASGGFAYADHSHSGWTLGGGLEYAFTNNIIGGIEGYYVSLGKGGNNNTLYIPNYPVVTYVANNGWNNEFGVIRARISYKF